MKVKVYPLQDRFICPFCNQVRWAMNCGNIEFDNYSDYPMIWCDCGARAVFDPKSFEAIVSQFEHSKPIDQLDEANMHEIPLLFIERAADYRMTDYRSDRVLTDAEVVELTRSYDYHKHDNGYDPAVAECLGLKKCDEYEDFDEVNRSILLNISVPINSYNDHQPAVPHEALVDLSHDGVYVTLKVRELDGSTSIVRYCGD